MKEAMLVHVGQTKHRLEHYAFNLLLGELLRAVLHQLVDVLLHVLKDKVKIVVYTDHFLKFDDLRMVKLAKRLDLSEGHALLPRVELLFHFLDGYLLFALNVDGLHN